MSLIHSPEFQWPSGDLDATTTVSEFGGAEGRYMALSTAKDPASRVAWLRGAFRGGNSKHVDRAVDALADENRLVRETAAEVLGATDPVALDESLWRWLVKTNPTQRAQADDVLPMLKTTMSEPLLERIRDDNTPVDRMAGAAYLLGRMGVVEAANGLKARAWTREPTLAYASAEALARVARENELPALQELATHPEPGIRVIVVQGAANVGGKAGIELLHAIALHPGEPSLDVRREAIAALGTVYSPDSVHALIDILRRRTDLRNSSIDSLKRITRLPLDPVMGTWLGWYQVWRQNPIWPIPLPTASPFDPDFVQGNFSP